MVTFAVSRSIKMIVKVRSSKCRKFAMKKSKNGICEQPKRLWAFRKESSPLPSMIVRDFFRDRCGAQQHRFNSGHRPPTCFNSHRIDSMTVYLKVLSTVNAALSSSVLPSGNAHPKGQNSSIQKTQICEQICGLHAGIKLTY